MSILFACSFSRKENETRRTIEQQAEQARKYEFEQVSYLEEQRKKREDFQRYFTSLINAS